MFKITELITIILITTIIIMIHVALFVIYLGHTFMYLREKKIGSSVHMPGTKIAEASLVEYPSGC